jgi:hypothetical protein
LVNKINWLDMKTLTLLHVLLAAGVVAGPALAQAPVLDVSTKGDYVYLDYNPPGSKAPAVKFACAMGSGRVDIAQYEAQPTDQTLKLSSGGATTELAGAKATGTRGDFVKTRIFGSDKIMTNFRTTGELEMSGQGFQDHINAGDAKPTVEKFFVGCEEGA